MIVQPHVPIEMQPYTAASSPLCDPSLPVTSTDRPHPKYQSFTTQSEMAAEASTFRLPPYKHRKQDIRAFGNAAASRNLLFPKHAKITAAELLAFLPNSVQCADVIYRLISNGGTRQVLWAMIYTQRDLVAEWNPNSCGTAMYKAMQHAGFEKWTVGIHYKWHEERKPTWDETNLSVAAFRTPGQISETAVSVADIPFRQLAVDVRYLPGGDDALDLTRMVQHCAQNPQELWMYPRDYDTLLEHLGGSVAVRLGHLDREAFRRWAGIIPPPRRIRVDDALSVSNVAPDGEKTKGVGSSRTDAPIVEMQSRTSTPMALGSRDTTPFSNAQQKKKGRRPKKIRYEEEASTGETEIRDGMEPTRNTETYVRAPAEYVAPVGNVAEPPKGTIRQLFVAERAIGEKNPFSPYAFGGPRSKAPYRMLHRIGQPHPTDRSGWAENLRWAYEQRACFSHSYYVEGWNESPEHMELIATTRKDQVWASDELLAQIAEEQLL
jgi:hypothetical protein